MKDNLKIKREEGRREENPLRTPILVPAGLLIRRGSVPEAKLRMAKRLGRARAVTKGSYSNGVVEKRYYYRLSRLNIIGSKNSLTNQ
jgi:hypothetical protein